MKYFLSDYVETDVRPSTYNTHKNCKGDCTTRALTYALKGAMTYDEVEAEQYRIASLAGARRNTVGNFDLILTRTGKFAWLQFDKCILIDRLAYWLKTENGCYLPITANHIAVIERGRVIDNWDCRSRSAYAILCPVADIERAMSIINLISGANAHRVDTPKPVRQRFARVRRHSLWNRCY